MDKRLFLNIKDEGVGFDMIKVKESRKRGLGLSSMYDRINAIGGKLTINSELGKGTEVSVVVRLENNHFEEGELL